MGKINGKNHLLETNFLLERFLIYREVFSEHFKTMKVIERGEALRYETYSRLADNYIVNVHQFVRMCNKYLEKYNLENSSLADSLNQYLMEVISAINCLDFDKNLIDHRQLEKAKEKIRSTELQFMSTIGNLAK
ncbi:hypothetical protein COSHB9_12910 [Companilactobacillus alimentarius]|uniref:hypothetical protein n=1 Tax=Companilactobacillus alimentarius TaxID=1602 RepID=UPI003D7D5EE8